jgi:hypothetical protein
MHQVPTHVDDARDLLWRADEEGGIGRITVASTGASSGTRAGRAPTWRTPRCRIDDRCPIENRFEPSYGYEQCDHRVKPAILSRAGAAPSQAELHVSDGSGAGASVADRRRLLREIRLAADDVDHGDQPGRKEDRDVPMWPR